MLRVFVVGCSRSGTSVVQKTLSRELGLWTLPETRFFQRHLGSLRGRVTALRGLCRAVTDEEVRNRYIDCARMIYYLAGIVRAPVLAGSLWSDQSAIRLFQEYCDRQATRGGFAGWLEKTPKHFRHLDTIRHGVENPRFVLIFRNGEDVVSSIRDRYNKYPNEFPQEADFLYGVKLWNESMSVLIANENRDDVYCLCYEDFVADPAAVVSGVSSFLGVNGKSATASRMADPVIARSHELWKQGTQQDIVAQQSKFSKVFNEAEQTEIRRLLNMDVYERMRKRCSLQSR